MLLDFFAYDFLTRALVAGVIVAIVAPMLGIFLTVRRYALIADTLSHASLAGVAIGILTGINPVITAIAVAIVVAIGIERLRLSGRFSGESILALFLSGSLAFAIVAMSAAQKFNGGVLAYLFGSITTVSVNDLWIIGGLGVVTVGIILAFYRKLFLLSFDEDIARANGLPVTAYSLLLAILTAATVAVSMRVVGVLLIGALMVIPVLAATQFNRGFKATMAIAVIISVASVLLGLATSYAFDLATGGTIVLCTVGLFLLSLFSRRFV
ncbi:MAG: metal ABC transporter permease [Patescibacteria group bacterium]